MKTANPHFKKKSLNHATRREAQQQEHDPNHEKTVSNPNPATLRKDDPTPTTLKLKLKLKLMAFATLGCGARNIRATFIRALSTIKSIRGKCFRSFYSLYTSTNVTSDTSVQHTEHTHHSTQTTHRPQQRTKTPQTIERRVNQEIREIDAAHLEERTRWGDSLPRPELISSRLVNTIVITVEKDAQWRTMWASSKNTNPMSVTVCRFLCEERPTVGSPS